MNLITGILIYNVDDFLLYLNKKNIKFNKIIQIIGNINFIIKKKKMMCKSNSSYWTIIHLYNMINSEKIVKTPIFNHNNLNQ